MRWPYRHPHTTAAGAGLATALTTVAWLWALASPNGAGFVPTLLRTIGERTSIAVFGSDAPLPSGSAQVTVGLVLATALVVGVAAYQTGLRRYLLREVITAYFGEGSNATIGISTGKFLFGGLLTIDSAGNTPLTVEAIRGVAINGTYRNTLNRMSPSEMEQEFGRIGDMTAFSGVFGVAVGSPQTAAVGFWVDASRVTDDSEVVLSIVTKRQRVDYSVLREPGLVIIPRGTA